ncbi:MAG: type II 3-dehydroquinate dehydratase [Legionellales bacterium]|nr:type II 3-dehydroquinate dehydratase [Legionellales bacterium]
MANILIIHGPNLNMLGNRETKWYGNTTLEEINHSLQKNNRVTDNLTIVQSNSEADIIDHIQKSGNNNVEFLVINPAGLGHTSVSLRDALLCITIPFIEVHLSNVYQREAFRQTSKTWDIAMGIICGLGAYGYILALQAAQNYLEN